MKFAIGNENLLLGMKICFWELKFSKYVRINNLNSSPLKKKLAQISFLIKYSFRV